MGSAAVGVVKVKVEVKVKEKRIWDRWQLYTGKPMTLGCKPWGHNSIYHIKLSDLETREGSLKWLQQIEDKPPNYNQQGFVMAVKDLIADGTIKVKTQTQTQTLEELMKEGEGEGEGEIK